MIEIVRMLGVANPEENLCFGASVGAKLFSCLLKRQARVETWHVSYSALIERSLPYKPLANLILW